VFVGHHDKREMLQILMEMTWWGGGDKKDKRLLAKVTYYFPIIPHLK
jgi:hypothetical protein